MYAKTHTHIQSTCKHMLDGGVHSRKDSDCIPCRKRHQIGVRIPDDAVLLELLKGFAHPLLCTRLPRPMSMSPHVPRLPMCHAPMSPV